MKDPIRKTITRAIYTPIEIVRRRQAEHTPIATVGLQLPYHLPHEELQNEPSLEDAIDYFREMPDGDHYLAAIALQPVRFAMARRALRAISDQNLQLLAIADVLEVRKDNHGIIESFWRRRLRRQVGKVAAGIATAPTKPDLGTIRALSRIAETVRLPGPAIAVVTNQEKDFGDRDDIGVAATILDRLSDELAEQQEEAKTELYDPFTDI